MRKRIGAARAFPVYRHQTKPRGSPTPSVSPPPPSHPSPPPATPGHPSPPHSPRSTPLHSSLRPPLSPLRQLFLLLPSPFDRSTSNDRVAQKEQLAALPWRLHHHQLHPARRRDAPHLYRCHRHGEYRKDGRQRATRDRDKQRRIERGRPEHHREREGEAVTVAQH